MDYTPERRLEKGRPTVVREFMAHHQGMTLVALANGLLGDPMPRRFHAEPRVRATELLLQERIPAAAPILRPPEDLTAPPPPAREAALPMSRRLTTPHTDQPRTHWLSNGLYHVMLTNAGSGRSS